ncbi:FAD-binding oxidoreductase [Pseudomonas syringae]|uniref:FAD-binding oxidoreductase n=1 Tax=Pseudomonas syringae TaxID=317 RepID=A0A1C7YZV9_PSESX|nr:FAD-dependent oxidoreductase [Pseudomonas syringae]OCR22287.1 FAD-binding oxidoreductase [Pseudomonas syringae]
MFMDYEVAVIGAGIVGASIAAKLCSAGISVALIDKDGSAASGASALSGGLVRLYDPDPLLMELAAYSIGVMREGIFAATYARALRRSGVLYRAAPDQQERISRAIEQHASAQYPMRLISSEEFKSGHFPRSPSTERINLYEPQACVGNVRLATAMLANSVRQDGLLLENCEVKAIECRSRHQAHIDLGAVTLRCRAVVVAAGAWSRRLLPELHLQTRSIPLARVVTATDCSMPIIDSETQAYAIPLTCHLVQAGCGFREVQEFPENLGLPDVRNQQDARERVHHLLGANDSVVLDVLPGFDSYSPDGRPLVGFCDGQSPVYLATGLCGLGFKLAPGIAQIAFEQLQRHLRHQDPDGGWSALSPGRAMSRAGSLSSVQP